MTGAQFEIRIDSTSRSYRDRGDISMQSAEFLKRNNPNSLVEIKDLQTGVVIAVTHSGGR
jgi:hypothetical protein